MNADEEWDDKPKEPKKLSKVKQKVASKLGIAPISVEEYELLLKQKADLEKANGNLQKDIETLVEDKQWVEVESIKMRVRFGIDLRNSIMFGDRNKILVKNPFASLIKVDPT